MMQRILLTQLVENLERRVQVPRKIVLLRERLRRCLEHRAGARIGQLIQQMDEQLVVIPRAAGRSRSPRSA